MTTLSLTYRLSQPEKEWGETGYYPIKLTRHVRRYASGGRLVPEVLGKRDVPKGVVSTGEVEEAVFGDTRGRLFRIGPAERNPEETVYEYFGRTKAGRYLMVVLIYLGQGVAMPVTDRNTTRGERSSRYERGSS